ncbi:uncharacterized protein LOC125177949 [Hyalella azteca]|uniref:Uncharacterized protein LOC125177949 n=1 Tax=Hyalella azteca TaxID=294128 RepID=A0A979FI74_HYAAZ|nr:uncharacterized protein LOC125177949 [Hyalella azteca]
MTGLKRVHKVYALNEAYGEDAISGEEAARGEYDSRNRTTSISVPRGSLHDFRLKRNYTVAAAHKRVRSKKSSPQHGSSLYHQQLSMPSESFQQLAVPEYEQRSAQHIECIEKAFGSMDVKHKLDKTKKKKNSGEEQAPVVLPLPSCSEEVMKVIGLDSSLVDMMQEQKFQFEKNLRDEEPDFMNDKNLRGDEPVFQSNDSERNNELGYVTGIVHNSSRIHHHDRNEPKYRSRDQLHDSEMIPEKDTSGAQGTYKTSEITSPNVDIVQRIEEIKERIDVLTKAKEKAISQRKTSEIRTPVVNKS